MTKERESTLQLIVNKGERARRFKESDFYLKDLQPYLLGMEADLKDENLNVPGRILIGTESDIVGKIAITTSLNSGQLAFLQNLKSEIECWISQGEEKKMEIIGGKV